MDENKMDENDENEDLAEDEEGQSEVQSDVVRTLPGNPKLPEVIPIDPEEATSIVDREAQKRDTNI